MADSYESLWRGLLLRVPLAPVPLIQQSLNAAYRRSLALHRWSALRKESAFYIAAPYTTGTVSISAGSTSIVGVGTTWTAAMTGYQLVLNSQGPFYTFTFLTSTTGTLDRAFNQAAVSAVTYSLQQIYVTPESDFDSFEEVRDVANAWRLRLDLTQADLDRFDPQRSVSADAWAIVAAPYTADPPKFELWPRPTGPKSVAYRYQRDPGDLSAATDTPIPPITGDILRDGALAELALWPGTTGERNPFFNPALNATYEQRFQSGVATAQMNDQERSVTDITPGDRYASAFPLTAAFLQSHVTETP